MSQEKESGSLLSEPVEITQERPDSVEISVNAKREISYKIKIYAETGRAAAAEAMALKAAMDAWVDDQKAQEARRRDEARDKIAKDPLRQAGN